MRVGDYDAFTELSSSQLKTLGKNYASLAFTHYAMDPERKGHTPEFNRQLAESQAQRFVEIACQLGQKGRSNSAVVDILRDYARRIGSRIDVNWKQGRLKLYYGL